eukprot:COSAG02_NODE_26156_length_639_cov_1.407407_1_plen_50_part_00
MIVISLELFDEFSDRLLIAYRESWVLNSSKINGFWIKLNLGTAGLLLET